MKIQELIRHLESWSTPRAVDGAGEATDRFICRFPPPVMWDPRTAEETLGLRIPSDLADLWSSANGATFFEEIDARQWGLVIWSPQETMRPDDSRLDLYREKFERGDLPIGKFLGDEDLVVLRCSESTADFGSVAIAIPDYPRSAWFRPAASLAEFLEKFAKSPLVKYWES
jgi:hypothetical protein